MRAALSYEMAHDRISAFLTTPIGSRLHSLSPEYSQVAVGVESPSLELDSTHRRRRTPNSTEYHPASLVFVINWACYAVKSDKVFVSE